MDRTKISSASSQPEAGLTLIEMLAALAIAATLTSFVALSLAGSRSERALDEAASQLAADLRAARTEARRAGDPIQLIPSAGGYTLEALSVERRWPGGIEARWHSPQAPRGTVEAFVLTPTRLSQAGLTVTLSQADGAERDVGVEAITGRVDAQ